MIDLTLDSIVTIIVLMMLSISLYIVIRETNKLHVKESLIYKSNKDDVHAFNIQYVQIKTLKELSLDCIASSNIALEKPVKKSSSEQPPLRPNTSQQLLLIRSKSSGIALEASILATIIDNSPRQKLSRPRCRSRDSPEFQAFGLTF